MNRCPPIIIPYMPRPLQKKLHRERKRFSALVTHRRFGKTVAAVCELIRRAVKYGSGKRAWRAGYVAPYRNQAKAIAWDYLKYFAGVIPGARFNESELRCDLPNGARIQLFGADNPDALRGQYFDDLIIDEAADVSREVWRLVLLPTLADREGWVLFTGTPKGMNNLLYDVVQEAQANPDAWALFIFKASETGYVPAEELERLRAVMSEDEYAQEWECSFAAAIQGAYWARELDKLAEAGRICPVPHEPLLPVYTAWDLGMDDAMCIWFFQLSPAGERRFIDYYENSGEGLEHYTRIVLGKGFKFARHFGPHDIMVRELGTGKSRFEVARGLGIRFEPVRNIPVIDGIDEVRRTLPLCWFDAAKCGPGLTALRQYRKVYNARLEVFGKPLHDWTSHPADAFRYGAVGLMPEKPDANRQTRTNNRR